MPPKALMSQYRVGRQSQWPAIHIATPQEPQGLSPAGLPLSGIVEVADAVAPPTARGVSASRRSGRRDADGARPARGKLGLGSSGGGRPGLQVLLSAKAGKTRQGPKPQRPVVVRVQRAARMAWSPSAGVARRALRSTVGLKAGDWGIAETAVNSYYSPFPGIVSPAEALAAARSDESGCEPCPVGLQMSRRRPSKRLHEVAELLDEHDCPGRVPLRLLPRGASRWAGAAHGAAALVKDSPLVGMSAACGAECRASSRLSKRRFDGPQTTLTVCPHVAPAAKLRVEPNHDAVPGHRLRQRQFEHAIVDPAQAIRGGMARRIALVPDPFSRCLARFPQDQGRGSRAAAACAVERRLAIGPGGGDQAAPAPDRHAVEPELRRKLATGSRRPGEHVRRNGAQLVEGMDTGEHRAGGRGEAAPARTAAPALQRTAAFPPSTEIPAAAIRAAGHRRRRHLDGTQRAARQQLGTDALRRRTPGPASRQGGQKRIGESHCFSHVTPLVGAWRLGSWQPKLNKGLSYERSPPTTAGANTLSRHDSVAASLWPDAGGPP
jgi:hypothetical protein